MSGPPFLWMVRLQVHPSGQLFNITSGREWPVSPEIQDTFNTAFQKSPNVSFPMQFNKRPRSLPPPITVEWPGVGWQYVLELRDGMTQWFCEAQGELQVRVKPHPIYESGYMDIPLRIWRFLERLQPYCFPPGPKCMFHPKHTQYGLNVICSFGKNPEYNSMLLYPHTRHSVCGDAKLADIFTSLAGQNVNHQMSLRRIGSGPNGEIMNVGRCYSYSQARKDKILVKDLGWLRDNGTVWLMPFLPIGGDGT